MITTILFPEHFKDAAVEDIERELIGLVLDELKRLAKSKSKWDRIAPAIEKRILTNPDKILVKIKWVRTNRYHSPSKPGWSEITSSTFKRKRKHNMIEVLWIPELLD